MILSACSGNGEDSAGGADDSGEVSFDADADGYDDLASGGTDCDDEDATVHPGAEETWYDGVDADCDGHSDYDADGDDHDALEHDGDDCDDQDSAVAINCEESAYPLDYYAPAGSAHEVPEISSNLSGITWNPSTGTYMAVLDSNRRLHEFDATFSELREIELQNVEHTDTEDLVYLGSDGADHEYAIVAEDGTMVIGTIPDDGSTTLDLAEFQLVTYAPEPDSRNQGGEGVAYDAATETFWVCVEKNPMTIYTFNRPEMATDISYESGLAVTEPFDAEAALGSDISDISSCYYDERTGRLLVLSHEASMVLDVAFDGTVLTRLEVDITTDGQNKPEGLALNDDQELALVGEPNNVRIYSYSGP